jgi:hypothetical protein
MWLMERLISTPSTHAMHHGKHLDDGVTHYKGNYGNLLFLWDVLFGTARITRRYPAEYGVENLSPMPWYRLVFLPWQRPGDTATATTGLNTGFDTDFDTGPDAGGGGQAQAAMAPAAGGKQA